MSALALGTAQFGLRYGIANQEGQVDQSAVKLILARAATSGIDTLDTAIAYGESEQCLGQADVSDFKIITKLPAIPERCPDLVAWIEREVKGSLERLGIRTLYGLLLHRPLQLLDTQGQMLFAALQDLKANGIVKKIGISIYAATELDLIYSRYPVDIVQAPFNLVDRGLQTSGWLERLKENDVEVHTRSAFLQGLLLMPREVIPAGFAPWNSLWKKWHDWLQDNNCSAVEACLAFPLRFPEIDRVVVGVDNIAQFEQLLAAEKAAVPATFPDIFCDDERLINPARWAEL